MQLIKRLRDLFVAPLPGKQGLHPDPMTSGPPEFTVWSQAQIDVWKSDEMEAFRSCLCLPGTDVRQSVLEDLALYHGITPEQARERCLHWEEWSVREWSATARTSRDAVQAFYNSVESWTFDCLWYAYLQATGHAYPASVLAARYALTTVPGGAHLDFGSGVGLTTQLFNRLGFTSTMADVSPTLLAFARWRMERRGISPQQINLTKESLPENAYDIVTAVDSLFCATNYDAAVESIYRSLKPDGLLLATFDIRAKDVPEGAWHLYDSVVELEHRLLMAGFKKLRSPAFMLPTYRRIERNSLEFKMRSKANQASLPVKRFVEPARRVRWPTPERLGRLLRRFKFRHWTRSEA